MPGEGSVTRILVDELHSSDIQGDETDCQSGVTPSIIQEHHS